MSIVWKEIIVLIEISENLRIGLISYAGMFINLAIAANYFVYRFFG